MNKESIKTPVPDPHWIPAKTIRHNYKCSRCMTFVDVPTAMGIPLYKFCPYCGAKMEVPDGYQMETGGH